MMLTEASAAAPMDDTCAPSEEKIMRGGAVFVALHVKFAAALHAQVPPQQFRQYIVAEMGRLQFKDEPFRHPPDRGAAWNAGADLDETRQVEQHAHLLDRRATGAAPVASLPRQPGLEPFAHRLPGFRPLRGGELPGGEVHAAQNQIPTVRDRSRDRAEDRLVLAGIPPLPEPRRIVFFPWRGRANRVRGQHHGARTADLAVEVPAQAVQTGL